MHDPRRVPARPLDRLVEDAVGGRRRGRVRREVEVHPVAGHVEAGERGDRGAGERDRREVVGIAGIGQDDRAAALDRAQRELHQACLRPGQDRDLAGRIELHAVDVGVAGGDCLLERREAGKRGVPVHVGAGGRLGERLDDVRRRPDLGVASSKVDERLAVCCRRRRNPCEQRSEVLLRQPLNPFRRLAHPAMLWNASAEMAQCVRCGGELEERFRFCPWCAQPQRRKIVEFFSPHPRDAGKALRITRYLTEDPHIRFSVWNESGMAEGAVSLDEREAGRVARFLRPVRPQASLLDVARRAAGRRRPRTRSRTA